MSEPRDPGDELLEEVRGMIGRADSPLPEVTEYAKAALGWRRLDAELAELLADSALDTSAASGIRSGESARRLSFVAGDVTIDLEVRIDGAGRALLGQLAPAPAVATVEVQLGDSHVVAAAGADRLGRFRLTLASGGLVRLRVHRDDPPATDVETSWLWL